MNASIEGKPRLPRLLTWASWIALVGAIVAAVADRGFLWGINATTLGANNMGLALFLSFAGAFILIGLMFATPLFALMSTVSFGVNKKAGWRFLAAAAVCAIPLAFHVLS